MCGICGVLSNKLDGSIYQDNVSKMVNSMLDRGPDNSSILMFNGYVFGHTRLAIMDPGSNLANQPIENSNWILVFNGEIYNYKSIRQSLKKKGYIFYSDSDTEVLLNAIDCYGVKKTLKKINGIFAFAAFRKKTKKTYLVRDRLGIKPLYVHVSGKDAIYFASTPAAIAKSIDKTWDIDYQSVLSFLHLGSANTLSTFFKTIEKVRPAECITIDADLKISRERYWKPEYKELNIEDEVERIIKLEKEAHVESAVFLSGGVDSSLMASILKDIDGFHLSSPEELYANNVAEHLDISLHIKNYDNSVSFDDLLQAYSKSSGEASASSPIPMMVSDLISKSGFKVAFSANGADELFFGYDRTVSPGLKAENQSALWYENNSFITKNEQIQHIFRDLNSFKISRMKSKNTLNDLMKAYSLVDLDEGFSECAQSRWFEIQTYIQGDLNPTLDFSSMHSSLEVRVPFLNYELVEAALSIDCNQMISCDYGRKTPLKRMLKKRGFNPVLWSRKKLGFSIKDEILQKRDEDLRIHLDELSERGVFEFNLNNIDARDHIYLKSAAHALNVWMREWVDTGKVAL